jgi:hypothetical protein
LWSWRWVRIHERFLVDVVMGSERAIETTEYPSMWTLLAVAAYEISKLKRAVEGRVYQ